MASIAELIVRLLADTGNFNASMDAAAAKVTASSDAMAASMATSMQSFRDFDNITKESVKSADGLAQAQAALTAVQQTGAFTSEELAAKQALVDAAMLKVGKETQAASGALSMFTRNSRTMYSTSALITDAMTGQFSRMRREVAALGNETGLMAQAFRFAVSPAGLIAGALAAIALDAYNATQKINELQHAVLAGGGASGLSGDQLETMAEGFKKMGFDIQSARDAENALAQSGRVTQSDIANATQASLAYAQITGEKIDTLAKKFASVGTEGATGFIKLDESMHFLTNSQRENIAELAKQGDTAKAVSVGYDALATHGMMALQQLQDEGKKTEGFWAGVGTVFQNANDSVMKGMGFGLTKQDELDETNKLIAYYQQIGASNEKINELIQKRAALEAQMAGQARTSTARGAGAQSGIQSDEKLLHGGLHEKGSGISALETQFKEQESAAHASYGQMKVDAADFWNAQATDARNSAAVQAQAWQKYIEARHQLDEQGLQQERATAVQREKAERKAAEASRKANERQLQPLEQVRNATKQASQDRVDADLKEVQFAIRAFGQKSTQFSAALRQMEQDSKEFVAKEKALTLQSAEGTEQVAQERIDVARQSLREQYDAHQINAQQLLQGELRLDGELLRAHLAYLRKKEELDASDPLAMARDQTQIKLATMRADQQRLADLDKFHKEAEQKWRQYTQRVDGMVASQTNAIIFQHQTLQGAITNVLESMTEEWIRTEITQLTQTKLSNAQKVASAAGVAGAQGVASFAGAPWPIDMGAPAFGAAMMAEAAGFGAVASAARGWERVPADGMLTELHRDEMVLPKHVADPVRNMARTGGNGGGTIVIQANDAASFQDMVRRNRGALVGVMREAYRRGHF